MSNKTVSGLTHLLQGMAISMSDGKAEVDVKYVPVSNTPYVRIELGKTWDDLDVLHQRMCMELASRGFKLIGGDTLVKRGDAGFTYIEVGSVTYDGVRKVALLDLSASGPYPVEQSLNRTPRDPARERRDFEGAVSRAGHEEFLRMQGAESMVNALLTNAPFKIPFADMQSIRKTEDLGVLRRIAVAFAGQRLESLDDLVEAADLSEVLGREPVAGPRT